jgi:hypothetical protein
MWLVISNHQQFQACNYENTEEEFMTIEFERNPFKRYKSTARLRELKKAALEATMNLPNRDKRLFMIESCTLHFFEDCCLMMTRFVIGQAVIKENEMSKKTLAVYTTDLKEWKEYKNQFEPKEGYHHAVQYEPHNEPFPTKVW